MAGYNRIIIIGNLTRDPELKQLGSGQTVCQMTIAANRQFKNRQTGLMVQEVCFVDVEVWGAQAESCKQYLQKGRPVLVEGRLKLSTWKDNDGQNKSKHSIVADKVVFLSAGQNQETADHDAASEETIGGFAQTRGRETRVQEHAAGAVVFKDEAPFDDDLPF